MSRMPVGQYRPGSSIIHRMNASVKLYCFLVFTAAIILTRTPLGGAIILASVLAVILLSGIGLRAASASVGRMWCFFAVVFLMNALFFEGTQPLWSWWIFRLSAAGAIQGAAVVARIVLLMLLSNVLTCTTPPIELTGAIEGMISPLRLVGVPTRDVAMILSVAIQFIPTLLEEADMIRKAQTARGARFESRRLTEKAASFAPLVVPIFLSAFRRADELSMAMEARGYHRSNSRVKRRNASFGLRDAAALALSCGVCAAQVFVL